MRALFVWFGHPDAELLTDADIEAGAVRCAQILAHTGLSTREAADALRPVASAGITGADLHVLAGLDLPPQ